MPSGTARTEHGCGPFQEPVDAIAKPPVSRTLPLPEYAKPPVVEVACSIQFDPVVGLHAAHLGLLWQEYRDRFPVVQQYPPLPVMREEFEAARSGVSFNMLQPFGVPRLWFLNGKGTRLIQVQPDHFIVNWRRLDTEEPYPRYPVVRQMLVEELDRFRSFLRREELPEISPRQTELSYVNHIDAKLPDGSRKPLDEVVRLWRSDQRTELLPPFEEASLNARYIIRDAENPVGRLHIAVEPQRFVKDGAPLYAVTLIARGVPKEPDVPSALESLDRGHKAIVEGFTAVTTDEMHATWERQR